MIDLINALDPPRIFYKNEELPERIQFLPSNDKSSLKNSKFTLITFNTRKYQLRGYFLGVLTHTTAWD